MSLSPPLKTELMNIYFDESGQDSDRPSTMGGLLIPCSVYNTAEMMELNKQLESGKMKLYWTEYTGHAELRENIKKAINVFSNISRFTKYQR
ncbi:hypothetical protein QNH48_19545 [Neobacillus sp. YX16]|uniref:hypothetical protein n=1 Tax=Neobacillus sp. YX16 TaxID=3047874 RepID=UPI0024C344EF|nr:hypothetical protein [Neobacillus sp. YX16]WHZ01188.1 hypothetical protein QNH48_19545 [Neobacillus sp. YX16]